MTTPNRLPPAHDNRWRRLVPAAACRLLLFFAGLWAVFWMLSGNVRYATLAAGVLTLAAGVSATLVARAAWAARLAGRRRLNVVLVSWAALPALVTALLAAALGVPALPAIALGLGAGVVAGGAYARQRGQVLALQTVFPLAVDTLAEAELLRAATQQPNEDPSVPAGHRAVHRLNHARALSVLAMRDDDHDRLVEALPLLRAVVHDETLDPSVALLAADDLVSAESMLAERGRDGGRYAGAIELYAQLLQENPGIPGGQARLHEHRAEYQQYLARGASEDLRAAESAGDQAGAERASERLRDSHHAVEQELTAALELTTQRAAIRPQYLVLLGSILCSFDLFGENRSDEGIDLCRQALALRAGRTREQRPTTELILAHCLLARWDQRGDDRDLDEAGALLRRLVRQGNPVEARAQALLLEIAVRRADPGR